MNQMKTKIINLMKENGDDFVKSVARCAELADEINYMKLRDAFPGMFQTYHPSNWVGKDKK